LNRARDSSNADTFAPKKPTGDIPALIIGFIAFVVARAAGKARLPSLFYALTAVALGFGVAFVKSALAAH